jgi:uncharacterized membrane protein YbhN (UPF0104 family)
MPESLSGIGQEGPSEIGTKIVGGKVRSTNWHNIFIVLRVLAGLALLILSIHGINIQSLVSAIHSVNILWLILAIGFVLLGLGLKLWRWAALIRNYHIQASFTRLFSAYFVGQAANILLPFRSGELFRMGYFAEEKSTLPEAASTIILEKYLDLLSLTICALVVSFKISLDNVLNLRGFLLPIVIVVTAVLLAAIIIGPLFWNKIKGHKLIPQQLVPWLDRWVADSRWMRRPLRILPVVGLTILIWVTMWLTNLLLFTSLGLHLGGSAAGLVLVLVYIGLMPALMPGNIGPFYFFAALALLPFGIIQTQAVIFAVILHAIVTVPPLLGGAIGLLLRSHRPLPA